jgi:hypothetical protein
MREGSPGDPGARRPAARPQAAHPTPVSDTPTSHPPDAGQEGTAEPNPYENTPGHPMARGTLPMARYLTDLAIEDEIQALAAEATPMTEDQRAKLSRLLRLNRQRSDRVR